MPFLGYCYAFAFEFGYLHHFGFPYWLIHLSLQQVIVAISLLVFVVLLSSVVFTLLPERTRYPAFLAIQNAQLLPLFLSFRELDWRWLPTMPDWAKLILLATAFALIVYLSRLVARRLTSALERASARYRIAKPAMVLVIISLTLAPLSLYGIGTFIAQEQVWYEVVASPERCVVIRGYDENVICAPFDPASHAVDRRFRILEATSATTEFSLDSIGPLHIAPVAYPTTRH
jgi:hypothetical protein